MPVAETSAQWAKRLRRAPPENVFFIDPELIEPLQRAASREGVTVPALIKKALKMFLNDQRKG
jgi:hypothetical protein